MFKVIVQAGNFETEFIHKAKAFALRHFAEHSPKVVVRNADAYDPAQHEAADAIVTTSDRVFLIQNYEERGTVAVVVDAALESQEETAPSSEPAANAAPETRQPTRAERKAAAKAAREAAEASAPTEDAQ